MDHIESGYYWFHELLRGEDAMPVGEKPDICWFQADTQELLLMGYDMRIPYNPERHLMFERVAEPNCRTMKPDLLPPHVCDWQKSIDGGTEICKCGAWR